MRTRLIVAALTILGVAIGAVAARAASAHSGQVTFNDLPVPGATVSASHGDTRLVTSTDAQGTYRFPDLADGDWTLRVEMIGFAPITQQVHVAPDSPPAMWELKLRPLDELAREIGSPPPTAPDESRPAAAADGTSPGQAPDQPRSRPAPGAQRDSAGGGARQGGFQRTAVLPTAPSTAAPAVDLSSNDALAGAAEGGLLVNGSVNNAAASPFAQLAAFGNNRRGPRSLYTGGAALNLGSSRFDAAPFSFTGEPAPKPSYTDVFGAVQFGGPVRLPWQTQRSNWFIGAQRTSDHSATTSPALVPTPLERAGDFSHTVDALGRPVSILDPLTGRPFANARIPADRISPQAAALLGYYPDPDPAMSGRYNFQASTVASTSQTSVQTRLTEPPFNRHQFSGSFAYQRNTTDATNLFGFTDSTAVSGVDAQVGWTRRLSPFLSLRAHYQFTRLTTETMPYFTNRLNVSGLAGIAGNDQDPVNWGPPSLSFANGIEGLSDGQYSRTRTTTHAWNGEALVARGRHFMTLGADLKHQGVDLVGQQNPRGAFAFTGAATGNPLADFLLGIPDTASIALGNPDKNLRAFAYDAYVDDDWRVHPGLTIKAGVRWEYEAPFTERDGRLANLDVAPAFAAVAPVVAANPVGALTGALYPPSLLRPDRGLLQPRAGVAWRPLPGSSLVVRAGYGIYRNANMYLAIDQLLAQEPPLSKTFNLTNSLATPLTLASAFTFVPATTSNTLAVDPELKVGFAQNWQASVQRDLPGSMTVIATYLGTKGSNLLQEFLPNTYPVGAPNPCPACPSGFVYLTSGGRSIRHAGQLEVRRRLRSGLTATSRYTLSDARDNAGAFTGVSLSGSAIAQDWTNLDAEWAPSSFNQRHLVTAQLQYTTGAGVAGGTLLDGIRGALWKGWTVTSQLTAGSGLPVTPVVLTPVAGVTGTVRPDVVGDPSATPLGSYANPLAFAPPAPGRWGTAGRNSIVGPRQFALDMGLTRTFGLGDRLSLDWRVDATNILNQVTYAGVNTLVGSPTFGLANRANPMRRIRTALRLRF